MAEQLSENSRQGFAAENPSCIGLESDLSPNMRWRCGHVYDETPVGLAVYVRNDPVNLVDPDGRNFAKENTRPNGAINNFGGITGYIFVFGYDDEGFLQNISAVPYGRGGSSSRSVGRGGSNSSGGGGSRSQFIHVTNVSTSGPNQDTIMKILEYIKNNINDDCKNHLPGVVGFIDDIMNNSMIAHAEFDTSINAFIGGTQHDDLPAGIAIAVNDLGLFFNPSLTNNVAGFEGGTSKAQLLILLHELGHITQAFGPNENDFGDQSKVNANNNFIKQHCGAMIDATTIIF
jgi:hypothetical protein